ncbi:entericidin A [Litorimonas taeanensis]|uniref:Entericidin A n=1 Tax=Litorimonas taeanensis TaxID=568099 RepID=A0A420WD42_9PROT|nr:entericidin A/B family lipoprotein [Litorimonas taeanensis]RKQ68898.1 entericidin A [Litorimonas taeanensis]
MEHLNAKNFLATLVALGAFSLTACNTVEGVGQDLESAGDKAEEVTRN